MGIAIRKDKETFRDFNDVLKDLSFKWKTLSDLDKADKKLSLISVMIYRKLRICWKPLKLIVPKCDNLLDVTMGNQQTQA